MVRKKTKRSLRWIKSKSIKKPTKYTGTLLVADFWSGQIIEDQKEIEKILIEAAKNAKNTPLKVLIHKFQPQGITGVVLLAESHIFISTWPEINYVAIDIFSCGEKARPEKAFDYLKKIFKPKIVVVKKIKRGVIS